MISLVRYLLKKQNSFAAVGDIDLSQRVTEVTAA
jgi:hypothetical protein